MLIKPSAITTIKYEALRAILNILGNQCGVNTPLITLLNLSVIISQEFF